MTNLHLYLRRQNTPVSLAAASGNAEG